MTAIARLVLAVMATGCLHVESDGEAGLSGVGELYLCDAVIRAGAPIEEERWCDRPFDPEGATERFADALAEAGLVTAASACVGAGAVEAGGTGIAVPCLLE